MSLITPSIKPNEILSSLEIDYLRKKNSLVGILLVLHAWAIIFISVFLFGAPIIDYALFKNFIKYQ